MEAIQPQIIDGENIYVITTIGVESAEAEQMRRDARRTRVQEYVRRYEERQQTVGVAVDINL